MSAGYAVLDRRSVVAVTGDDRKAFLQGLVSNDMLRVTPDHAAYALFLTPQGKFLHDFTIVESGAVESGAVESGVDSAAALLLDPETDRRADLLRRLKMYKLRSKIALEDRAEALRVVVAFGEGALSALGLPAEPGTARPFGGGIAFTDPRLPALGARLFLPADGIAELDAAGLVRRDAAEYDRLRLSLGVPDGTGELIPEKSIPLENRMDALNAISWDKGCYMGQELTARTKYRALIKKKLFPAAIDGPTPEPGTLVTLDGKDAGEIRSAREGSALVLLRLEEVQRAAANGLSFQAGPATLTPQEPGWDITTKG